jgi:hypothetical protein
MVPALCLPRARSYALYDFRMRPRSLSETLGPGILFHPLAIGQVIVIGTHRKVARLRASREDYHVEEHAQH